MTIGDDIFTILGMMPIRDRAGIQRATMADEAVKASGGNAEGQALTMQGQAPPQIQLPPMGGPGDVQLPDDVPTAFAAGKAKSSALPVPTERVVAASPAANPSPAVRRGSDMIADEMIKRKRMEDMNGLLASIGLVASSLRGGGDGSSRNALIEQAFGGGKATSVAEMIALNNLRSSEDAQAAQLAARQRAIDYATKTDKLKPEDAAALQDMGVLADRYKPAELRERGKIETDAEIRRQLEPQIDDFARATGSDPSVLRAQLKKDPQKVLEIMSPEKRASVRKMETETQNTELDMIPKAAKIAIWKQIGANPEAAARLGLTEQEVAEHGTPTALADFMEQRAKTRGEYAGKSGRAAAAQAREKFIADEQPKAQTAEDYLTQTAPELGRLWNDKIVTGTFEDLRRSVLWRPLATALGKPDNELTNTAQIESALNQSVVTNAKALGPNPSNNDAQIIAKVHGNVKLEPHELRGVITLNERANRQKLVDHNKRIKQNQDVSKEMGEEFGQVRKIPMPPPSKILQDDIYNPANAPLREGMQAAMQQVEAKIGTPQEAAAIKEYNNMKRAFEREFGAETSDWYLRQEKK